MTFRWVAALAAFTGLAGGPALAEPLLGTWATEPDHKGQVGYVVIRDCGGVLCGRVMRVIDRNGNEVVTRSMGRDLFWDLRPEGGGRYGGGQVWVPLHDRVYDARARLRGNTLRVQGCVAGLCDGQVWSRVQ